jgi:hypothetical protein
MKPTGKKTDKTAVKSIKNEKISHKDTQKSLPVKGKQSKPGTKANGSGPVPRKTYNIPRQQQLPLQEPKPPPQPEQLQLPLQESQPLPQPEQPQLSLQESQPLPQPQQQDPEDKLHPLTLVFDMAIKRIFTSDTIQFIRLSISASIICVLNEQLHSIKLLGESETGIFRVLAVLIAAKGCLMLLFGKENLRKIFDKISKVISKLFSKFTDKF